MERWVGREQEGPQLRDDSDLSCTAQQANHWRADGNRLLQASRVDSIASSSVPDRYQHRRAAPPKPHPRSQPTLLLPARRGSRSHHHAAAGGTQPAARGLRAGGRGGHLPAGALHPGPLPHQPLHVWRPLPASRCGAKAYSARGRPTSALPARPAPSRAAQHTRTSLNTLFPAIHPPQGSTA